MPFIPLTIKPYCHMLRDILKYYYIKYFNKQASYLIAGNSKNGIYAFLLFYCREDVTIRFANEI